MSDNPLPALAWLVFAVGIGVILIAFFSKGARARTPMRRYANALTGLFFCLVALTEAIPDLSGKVQVALLAAAVIAGGASWYIGRHARQMDRIGHRK